jgi:PBP1b-binding outer membrane lipoprotein LpoB
MKKLVVVSIMAFSVLLLAGCGKKAETVPTDDTVGTETVNTDKKEATKQQCYDIVKYGIDVAVAQAKGETKTVEELVNKAMALEEKYNLEGVEFENVCEKYMMDADFMKMVQK